MKRLISISFILALSSCGLFGQKNQDPIKVGVALTANNYMGDYADPEYVRIYAGGMFSLQKATRRHTNFHLKVGFGQFADQFEGIELPTGQDGQPVERFVETSFIHGELALSYRWRPNKRFQPFVHGGFGWMYFNPKDVDGRKLIRNTLAVSQGASTNQIVPQLPAGLGFELRLNHFLSLEAAYSYRFMPTDYLDSYGQSDALNSFDALQSINLTFMFSLGEGPELPPKKAKKPARKEVELIIED